MISPAPHTTPQDIPRVVKKRHLVLLGCGKMGSAMLKGWLQRPDQFRHISIIEPAGLSPVIASSDLISCHASLDAVLQSDAEPIDFVVLAVKPQMMAEAIAPFGQIARDDIVFLSIAAGLSCDWISRQLGGRGHIVRAMPNTPASVGAGITAIYKSETISEHQQEFCVSLLQAVGEVIIIPDEEMMDAVTALSGSGPAYVFLLAEAMESAGVKLGLPEALSKKLARGTVFGAGTLLMQNRSESSVLRENVTSKGGTTAAALSVLMRDDDLVKLVLAAMQDAKDRSRELGQ
ncbi:MAG: pyrroline-5-carboxylate reductase [Alphaproteobacteria bacterium]|jgi:pyrroline-5-carboxylate reductase|nr:pyrroline-5-carboxylate reductase [Alphaproteobacteria bacterium]